MRFLKVLGILICVLGLSTIIVAADKGMGIHEVSRITFDVPIHVGTALLPAGEYQVRHTMEGQDHVMVFTRAQGKESFKVKCTLVPLGQKAAQSSTSYELNAANERVLHEMIVRGDTAKHVF